MSRFGYHPVIAAMFLASASFVAGCAQQAPTATQPTPAPQQNVTVGQEVGAAVHNQIQVNFASGSDHLMPGADKQLDIAARLFRDVRPVMMFSVGYSNSVGSEFDNLVLSARRARTVKAALISRGIPANQIMLRAYGQSDPIEKSNPAAPENRRVLVTWDIM